MIAAERIEQVLKYLSIGLLEQNQEAHEGIRRPVTVLNDYIQRGWDQLSLLCFEFSVDPPYHLPDLVQWLHQPVEEWGEFGHYCQNLGYSGALLTWGRPTELCTHLGGGLYQAYNPHLELQDEAFKRIYTYCDTHNLAHDYSRAREFLNRNVIIPNIFSTLMADSSWDDEVRQLLKRCYEPIPANCYKMNEGEVRIVLCPHCGWPLQWRGDEAYCHMGGMCEQIVGDLSRSRLIEPLDDKMVRTTEGIQRYVVSPEIELIKLAENLGENYSLECILWPNVDSYDLLVTLPSGRRYAADMKDVSPLNIRDLANKARDFNRLPEWDEAYYIFPDYRANPSYLNLFDEHWNPNPQLNLKRGSVAQFINAIRKELPDEI